MLKTVALLWVVALGTSLVGFVALVALQGAAARIRSLRRLAAPPRVASVVTPPSALAKRAPRAEAARQVAEPIAG